VSDQEIAALSGASVATVKALREAFGFGPVAPLPEAPKPNPIPDYLGPWLGYESLFGIMSSAKISRAVGVPFAVVEQRREFLGVKHYQRVSRAARYEHLLGVVSNNVLAKLAGVSPARIADMRKRWTVPGLPVIRLNSRLFERRHAIRKLMVCKFFSRNAVTHPMRMILEGAGYRPFDAFTVRQYHPYSQVRKVFSTRS